VTIVAVGQPEFESVGDSGEVVDEAGPDGDVISVVQASAEADVAVVDMKANARVPSGGGVQKAVVSGVGSTDLRPRDPDIGFSRRVWNEVDGLATTCENLRSPYSQGLLLVRA
jgi:hypothetical protein